MRAVVIRSLAVIAVGAVILAGVLVVASTIDARPPQVLAIGLTAAGEDPQQAPVTTSIEVTFSEPVDPDSAVAALRIEPSVAGTPSWSGSRLIWTPDEPLALDTAYVVTIGPGVRDPSGNEMSEVPPPFEFRTTGRPSVVSTDPAHGAEEVPLEAGVTIAFSTLMDTPSVEAELRLRPTFAHELRWSGELLEIVPTEPLEAGREYVVTIGAEATDHAGVALGEPVSIRFRTLAPGLRARTLVPADGIEGIAITTPIAVVFDRPIDPDSLADELLTISPAVAGTLEVASLPGEASDDGSGRALRFTPSGPLPPTTTFDVELHPGLVSTEGGTIAEQIAWTFTTGPGPSTISNQVTFISDRGGVPNVWAMNPDGTGQRQLSTELAPVLDYAVAPDGSSLVVADGRRLVYLRADGSERRVLTDEDHLEFEPAYAPNGQRLAFGRAAEDGSGLGIWEWEVGGGDAVRLELPDEVGPGATPAESDELEDVLLRAPRYSPDGQALAFVGADGAVFILELPAQRLTRAPFEAASGPTWLADSSAVLVSGGTESGEGSISAPVGPFEPDPEARLGVLSRSGTRIAPSGFATASTVLAVATDGQIAYLDAAGALRITDDPERSGRVPVGLAGERIGSAAFGPRSDAVVVVVLADEAEAGGAGRIELLELPSGDRTLLAMEGTRPRWLP